VVFSWPVAHGFRNKSFTRKKRNGKKKEHRSLAVDGRLSRFQEPDHIRSDSVKKREASVTFSAFATLFCGEMTSGFDVEKGDNRIAPSCDEGFWQLCNVLDYHE
jgi:hypothetical protein